MEDDSSVLVSLLLTTGQGIAEVCDGCEDLYLVMTLYTKLTKLRRRFHRTQDESEPIAVEQARRRDSLEEVRLCGPRSFMKLHGKTRRVPSVERYMP